MQKRYNQEAPDTYISNGINGLPNVISKTFAVTPAISGKDFWNLTVGRDGDLNLGSFGQWTLTALDTFTATVKMWGAGGARGYISSGNISSTSQQGDAGSGGYATATITFRRGQIYVIQVGQGGARTTTTNTGATYLKGGVGVTFGGTEGGGYTGLFYDSASQGNILLLAGGGGGGGDSSFSSGIGGAGGGSSGGNASQGGSQGGTGGTQLVGGSAALFNSPTAGIALRGGQGQTTSNSGASLGGGGGGYFGGGGGNVAGGGGGSGRIGYFSDVTSATLTAGSGNTPGNSADADRGTSGQGGNATIGNTGNDGRLLIRLI